MKKFIKKIISGQQVSQNEFYKFIAEYCELQNKTLKQGDLEKIGMAIQHGILDFHFAIDEYCRLKNYTLCKLYNGNKLIKLWFQDE